MQSAQQPKFIVNRYEILDIVGRGGMGIVSRCFDHVTRQEVALKQMIVNIKESAEPESEDATIEASSEPQQGETIAIKSPDTWKRESPFVGMEQDDKQDAGGIRVALSHEFETLARLRHPNVITVLDYGFDALKLPFFTMPLLENPHPITESKSEPSFDQKIAWLIEMLQALAYLHHHKIIHRDLKPDNALVTADGTVKVLDFGLAVLRRGTDSLTDEDEDMISGTIPYMAPELIQGGKPTTKSDLFAFGMIAYELIAGRYPFDFDGVAQLIMRLITERPETQHLDVADPIKSWLDRLLATDPAYRTADALIALEQLTNITKTAIPAETKTIQESYLQTASFVGRDEELSILFDGLRSMRDGNGSAHLIVGENGVGKSRLLNELRILGLVNGVQVLQGYGSQSSLTPYHILREPVKRLLLSTPIDATEANVLKTLLPDLEEILGRKVPEVPQDEVSKYGDQLSNVLLKLFQQQTNPTLLILDDLHWSPESIEIVNNLVATVSQNHLMIVATQRPDSIFTITDELNEMRTMRLARLNDEDVAELARSILGDVGLRADVQQVLKREAQGNVNFLLEVIRALLDEVKHLRDIAMMRPPSEITAGGINKVLEQRLSKIVGEHRQVFDLIAIAGLAIDEKLLAHIAEQYQVSDESWLTTLSNHSIIEREGDGWQIAHDRLRDVALHQIPKNDIPNLHHQIATALEQLYPDTIEKSGVIANHWRLANEEERERPYLIDAADYALRLNSFQDAMRLFRRAIELGMKAGSDEAESAPLELKLGECLMYVGNYSEALANIQKGLDNLAEDQKEARAKALALLADAFWGAGQFADAEKRANDALAIAREVADAEVEVRSLSRLGMLSVDKGEYKTAEKYYEDGLAIAQREDYEAGLTMTHNNYGILFAMQGDFAPAAERLRASLELSERNQWIYRTIPTLINLGAISGLQGDTSASWEYFERALVMARAAGDRRNASIALDNLGYEAQQREDYRLALQYFEEGLQLAEAIGNAAGVPTFIRKQALVYDKMGDFETTQEYLMRAITLANEIQATPIALHALADLARVEADPEQAVQWAQFILSHEAVPNQAVPIAEAVIEKWRDFVDAELLTQYQESATKLTLDTALG